MKKIAYAAITALLYGCLLPLPFVVLRAAFARFSFTPQLLLLIGIGGAFFGFTYSILEGKDERREYFAMTAAVVGIAVAALVRRLIVM